MNEAETRQNEGKSTDKALKHGMLSWAIQFWKAYDNILYWKLPEVMFRSSVNSNVSDKGSALDAATLNI